MRNALSELDSITLQRNKRNCTKLKHFICLCYNTSDRTINYGCSGIKKYKGEFET